jgi:hypothetical protein
VAASSVQADVGVTWETDDGGPTGDELTRELDWLLDDAVAVRAAAPESPSQLF